MIGKEEALPQKRTTQHWKNARVQLAKHGLQGVPASTELLQQLQQICERIETSTLDEKELDQLLTEALMPTGKILVSMPVVDSTPTEIREPIELTLLALVRAGCHLFRLGTIPKVADMLLSLLDFKKAVYKQIDEQNGEVGVVGTSQPEPKNEATAEAPAEIPATIPLPSPLAAAGDSVPLPPIKQIQTEDEQYVQQDRKHRQQHPTFHPKAMKRPAYRRLATDLTEQFLSATDKVWQDFANRPVEFLDKYLALLKAVSRIVNGYHLEQLYEKVREVVWKCFTQPTEQYLRGINKDILQEVTTNCQALFDRLLLDQAKIHWCEHFVIEATLPLVRCKLTTKKMFGVKLLSAFSSEIQAKHSRSVTEQQFREWLCTNRILQQTLNLQNHQQVIQQAESVFQFLAKCGGLTQPQLELVLTIAQKGNPSIRKSMLNKLYTLVHRFSYTHYEVLMQRIPSWPQELFTEDLLDLVVSVCRYSVNSHCQIGRDVLWHLISSNTPLQFSDERLAHKFINLLKIAQERGAATDLQAYIDKAITLIERKGQLAVMLLRRMIELCPQFEPDFPEKRLDSQLINKIVLQRHLHLILLRKLQHPQLSKDFRQGCMDLLHILLNRYFRNFPEDNQLKTNMLLRLMKFPKLFSQLSQSLGSSTEELLTEAVARTVNTIEQLHCIWELFMNLNKQQLVVNVQDKNLEVRCRPDHLKCYGLLMQIITSTGNEKVRQETAGYLAAIHCNSEAGKRGSVNIEFVEEMLEKIKEAYECSNQQLLLGYYSIIEQLMNETERKGVGELVAHGSLVVTEHVKIKVRNDATYGYDVPNRIELPFAGSRSLYELLSVLAVQFKCTANQLMLYVGENQPIRDSRNGQAVEDLGIAGKDLTAKKVQREMAPYAKLVDESKNYTPRAREVFTEIFVRFSTDGKMTKHDLVRFVEGSTQDVCNINDSRITDTFDKFDTDKDDLLTLANFLDFYEDACRYRESTVWRNLEMLRYRHDLQKCQQVKDNVDYHNMTRFRLYKCAFSYDILFSLTQSNDSEVRLKAIRLLKRLPTSHSVLREILHEVGFNERDEFNVWYRLALVQYLLSKKEDPQPVLTESQKLASSLELKSAASIKSTSSDIETVALTQEVLVPWKKRFIYERSYEKIVREAQLLVGTPFKQMTALARQSLSLCLKILRQLNAVPQLNKPLPDAFEVKLVDLPSSKLVGVLLPQLFVELIPEMLEPLLCLSLLTKQVHHHILTEGLFHAEEQVRLICCNFIYLHEKQHGFQLNLMELPVTGPPQQFYQLLARIVRESPNLDLQKIFTAMQKEVEQSPQQSQAMMVGRLAVMHSTLQKQPELSVPASYQATLLKILHGTVNHDLRRVLYSMLLLTDPQGLVDYLNSFVRLINPKQNGLPRTTKHGGLYNLGCICYMNSMLQQFSMTPELRNAILGMRLPPELPQAQTKGKKFVDNLLYQLQKMFTYLQASDRSDYNPQGFCYSFNKNINVGVQQDAQQFLNSIVEKLETMLKGTPYKNLMRDIFGGKTLSTMTCQSCSKPRYKVEQFHSIVLEIKEKKNISESLNRLIEKQSISDFLCENCERRGEMVKETHLHTLPNVLIIHLQRIIFDIETMERTKIHSKFEFPMTVNLKDYLRMEPGEEAPLQSNCEYKLKGVVIHSGTPESGHYYSLIRVQGDSWFRFDDSRVSEFNLRDFEEQAFGGKEETSEWASCYKNTRSKNAYILVYEKTNKIPIALDEIPREELPLYQSLTEPINKQQRQDGTYTLKVAAFKSTLPASLKEQLKKDNQSFFHEQQYNHEYFRRFLGDLFAKLAIPQPIMEEYQANQLKAYYSKYAEVSDSQKRLFASTHELMEALIDNFSRMYNPDENLIKTIGTYLYTLEFAAPETAQKYFMSTDLKRHLEMLYSHGTQFVRELYRMTANKCINIIIRLRGVSLQPQENSTCPYRQKILSFVEDSLAVLYTEIPKNWLKSYNYFDFWKYFSSMNSTSAEFCVEKDLICQLVDLVLEKKSPVRTVQRKYELYIKSSSLSLGPILQTIVNLLSVHPEANAEAVSLPRTLTENQRKCLTCPDLYRLVLQNVKQEVSSISCLMTTFCTGNLALSEHIAGLLIHYINQSEGYEPSLCCMTLIHTFMLIKDDLTHQRIRWIFGIPQFLAAGNQFSIKNTVDSQVVSYLSSLYFTQLNHKSVLQLLYVLRRSPDNFSIAGVNILLSTLKSSEECMSYVADLPPPTYCLATYVDWIDKFIRDVRTEKYPVLTGDRATIADGLAKLMELVREKQKALRSSRGMLSEQPAKVEDSDTTQLPPPPAEPIVEKFDGVVITTEPPLLIPGPPQQQQRLLEPTQPILIIGRTCHSENPAPISMLKDDQAVITTTTHYTYTAVSLPTGTNNKALPKDLFETHTNYDHSPLKYFTYKETPLEIGEEQHPSDISVQPTIIQLKIATKLPVMLLLQHPQIQADLYLPEGLSYLTVPYTPEPLEKWVRVEPTGKKDLLGLTPLQPALTDAQKSSGGSLSYPEPIRTFIGPLPPDYYGGGSHTTDSAPVLKHITCPICTYENYGVSVCEICYAALPI